MFNWYKLLDRTGALHTCQNHTRYCLSHVSHVSSCKFTSACFDTTVHTDWTGFVQTQTGEDTTTEAWVSSTVLTSDCRAPSRTMMPLVDWSLFCDIVVRLQSRKSPRHFCFTSGRVMNLWSNVQLEERVIKGCGNKTTKSIPRKTLPSTGFKSNYNVLGKCVDSDVP